MENVARNKQRMIRLPLNMRLVAVCYGTGREDHMAVVLGYNPDDEKYVTWVANLEVQGKDGLAGCSNGWYICLRDSKYAKENYSGTVPDIERLRRQDLHDAAFRNFAERCSMVLVPPNTLEASRCGAANRVNCPEFL